MKCDRCGGIMAYEKFYHQTEQSWGWRCIICGEYVDPVISENRRFQKLNRKKGGVKKEVTIYESHSETPSA